MTTDRDIAVATLNELRAVRGMTAKIAEACRISSPAVSKWDIVPPNRVLEVERVSGFSRHRIRPDIYGREEAVA